MNKNCVILCTLLLAVFSLSACDGIKIPDVIWPAGSIDSRLSRIHRKAVKDGFSGVVLVRHRGNILLHEAAGMANKEQNIPNTTDTVFVMASVTKQYTAALIMALQEQGLLTVEDSLVDFFADVPKDKADITIHQLLTHTSGLRRNFGGDTVAINRETFLSLVMATRLEYEPGEKYQYSNAAYGVVAAIAEIVSGQPYEAALRKYILDPANLKQTGYLLPDWSRHTLAVGYTEDSSLEDSSIWWAEDGPYWNLRGSGGLRTTATDLLKWHDALSGEDVLASDSIAALQGRHVDMALGQDDADQTDVEYYGYGWITQHDPEGGVLHWHTGGNRYFRAFFGRAVDEDLIIVGLSNERKGLLEEMINDFGDAVLDAR